MSKQKMLAARELIQEKRYAEARALLKTINDPKAKEWLKKLDQIAPNRRRNRLGFVLVFGILLITILVLSILILQQINSPLATSVDAPSNQVVNPEEKEAIAILCMGSSELSRNECEDFAVYAITHDHQNVSRCFDTYKDNLDLFDICMKDSWELLASEWETERNEPVEQQDSLFTYCAYQIGSTRNLCQGWDCTAIPEIAELCAPWAENTMQNVSVISECWEQYHPFDVVMLDVGLQDLQAAPVVFVPFGECVVEQNNPLPN